ncbi:regulator [Streptomyces sp. NWU339]|uniref:Crp/Fnr family transcriptional regulator n=1 Tax=Streptomyces sp. NWU339 TaxID=2185284 RepID=UPI000D6754CA|nr:cyclic nucleotide-binding domain-containing protein [Streptomyces sp. NWU339]PWI10178.1 regulator [Streptomyces sp. NWU339]
MATATTTTLAAGLPAEHRERLMRHAHEVSFDIGARLFEEGRRVGRFWIIRTGTVALDLQVPGSRAAVIDSLGHGELVGCSWRFPPHPWLLGAETTSPVRAWEFDAEAVRALCAEDPGFGRAIAVWVGRVVARRLHATRVRLLDLYAPYGSGSR